MKIWCEDCSGDGYNYEADYDYEEEYCGDISIMCETCNGKGYTEQNKPTTEINIDYYNELKRKADFVDKMISPSANAIYKELNELRSKAEELDYLARIGRAMEKAFESGFSINQMHSVLSNVDYCMYDKESLLNWAESEGE